MTFEQSSSQFNCRSCMVSLVFRHGIRGNTSPIQQLCPFAFPEPQSRCTTRLAPAVRCLQIHKVLPSFKSSADFHLKDPQTWTKNEARVELTNRFWNRQCKKSSSSWSFPPHITIHPFQGCPYQGWTVPYGFLGNHQSQWRRGQNDQFRWEWGHFEGAAWLSVRPSFSVKLQQGLVLSSHMPVKPWSLPKADEGGIWRSGKYNKGG